MEFLNFINGEWLKANSDQLMEKFDPFSGISLGSAYSSTVIDLVTALQSAKAAAGEIEKIPNEKRSEKVIVWSDIIIRNAALWAVEIARFEGLPQEFVKQELLNVSTLLKKLAKAKPNLMAYSRPVGVVALSLPWCHTFLLALERIVPALLAGNSIILHLSEPSPVAKFLVELVQKSEWPKGSLQIIFGSRKDLVPLLAGHPGINALSYVGHEKHRDKIIASAALSGKHLQLHLSAKNSLIFLEPPADQNDMLNKLSPCLLGMGQTAWNAHRIFILETFRENFLSLLKSSLESLRPAQDPRASSFSLWPLHSQARVEKLKQFCDQVPGEQGQVFWGQENSNEARTSGFFAAPLFSVNLSNCSTWQQEDLRLPVFIITSVKYSHEIAKWSNTGSYGHSAVIWGPTDKARVLGQKLHVGQVLVNKWKVSSAHEFTAQKLSRAGDPNMDFQGSFFSEQTMIF